MDAVKKYLKIRLLFTAILCLHFGASAEANLSQMHPPKDFGIQKLKDNGLSSEIMSLIEASYDETKRDRVVQLNVLGFLGKGDYSGHYGKKAIKKCLEFIRKHRRVLKNAEKLYGVHPEVIAALLWVETKHGNQTGTFNVLSVYFSLLQADHPDVLNATLAALETRSPASVDQYRQKVIERSEAKAKWALTELKSLQEIHRKRAKDLEKLEGSYSGAFGIPQFIPSSYVSWARPKAKSNQPNLFDMDDAIHSVAHYLKVNGWKKEKKKSHKEALYHYNRSDDYVAIILKIARELKRIPT